MTLAVQHFSTVAVVALDDAIILEELAKWGIEKCAERRTEDPCRCGRFRVVESSGDLIRGGGSSGAVGCWKASVTGQVEYLDCPGPNGTLTESWNFEEDLKLIVEVMPSQASVDVDSPIYSMLLCETRPGTRLLFRCSG